MRNDAPIHCLYSFKEKTLYEEKKKNRIIKNFKNRYVPLMYRKTS